MKKILFPVIFTFLTISGLKAQNCFKYFPTKEGTTLEYTYYDSKDKVTATSEQTVLEKKTENGKQILTYQVVNKPVDSDTVIKDTFDIVCDKDGKISIDLSAMMPNTINGMQLEVEGGMLDFPKNPTVGQELEGTTMVLKMVSDGQVIMTANSDVTNRKVEAIEDVTTPAGTFHCIVISYEQTMTMGFVKTVSKMKEWYSENYGLIKAESYNKRGKLQNHHELTKIIK